MCKYGDTVPVDVWIDANHSHTGGESKRTVQIDRCIAPLVKALNEAGIETAACCCGHFKQDGRIHLRDGRTLIVTPDERISLDDGWSKGGEKRERLEKMHHGEWRASEKELVEAVDLRDDKVTNVQEQLADAKMDARNGWDAAKRATEVISRWLPEEELAEALQAHNRDVLCIGGCVSFHSKTVTLRSGGGRTVHVLFEKFSPSGTGLKPDFAEFEVKDYGHTVSFGLYEAAFEPLLGEALCRPERPTGRVVTEGADPRKVR